MHDSYQHLPTPDLQRLLQQQRENLAYLIAAGRRLWRAGNPLDIANHIQVSTIDIQALQTTLADRGESPDQASMPQIIQLHAPLV